MNESLPWRNSKEFDLLNFLDNVKDEVRDIKMRCLNNPEKYLWTHNTRKYMQMRDIFYHLKCLSYEDKPNYSFIREKLVEIRT